MIAESKDIFLTVLIKWKDNSKIELVTFCVNDEESSYTAELEDEIFFYLKAEEEIKTFMREDNGQDFVVLNYHDREDYNI